MNSKPDGKGLVEKRKRGRPKSSHQGAQQIVSEQADAYGISLPILTDSGERFLSPNDIAKIMNVTGVAVKQWIYHRKFPAVRLANGFWKVKVSDFESFLKARHETVRRHVLITGGNETDTAEIVKAVEALGYQAVLPHNYADALLKALDSFPALFVISISASDTDPWKFAEKLRSHKSLRSFPILFVGGTKISDAETEKAVEYHAQGILTRPLNTDVVKKEIDRILQRTR